MSEEVSQGMLAAKLAAKLAEEDAQRKRLNDLAAEKVMGWTRIADVEGDMFCSPLDDIWEAHSLCGAWQPVIDLNDAFALLEQLGVSYSVSDGEIAIRSGKSDYDYNGTRVCPMGSGTTAIARAITIACLRYVGVSDV